MASQTAASMNYFVTVNGKVVPAVSSGFIPQLLVLTQNPILPTGTVKQFTSAANVTAYFGTTSYDNSPDYADAINAAFYFKASNKGIKRPASILFYRYVEEDTGAFTRGAALSAVGTVNDLTELKLVTAGTLNLLFNGSTYNVTGVDLSSQNSFDAMAAALQVKIRLVSALSTVTCTWDSTTKGFTITFPYNGAVANTVGYTALSGTGSTDKLAQRMKITQAANATLSQGLAAQTPAQIMDAVVAQNQNFYTFICNFDVNSDASYAIDLGLIEWNTLSPTFRVYMCYDTVGGASSPISNPKQQVIIAHGYGQDSVAPYTFNAPLMYIINNDDTIMLPFAVAGVPACVDFNATNGMIQVNASTYAGIPTIINNDSDLSLLIDTFGANSYINLNTLANNFQWFERGNIGGDFQWFDTGLGFLWFSDQLQVQIATLMQGANSIPYDKLSVINGIMSSTSDRALRVGVIQKNIPLDSVQKAEITMQAGVDISSTLFNVGYYIPVIVPTPEEIATRKLTSVKEWYTYGGGPVQLAVNVYVVL